MGKFNMAENKKSTILKSKAKCAKKKNKSWSEEELTAFARVLSSNEERDKPWALVLETMALKKSSNEKVFEKILAELKEELSDKCVQNVDQLRRKYKWFKQEWRKINIRIRSGSGLATKDTEVPNWFVLLDPIFTQGVDNMMTLSSKAQDIRCENPDEEDLSDSSSESGLSDSASTSSKGKAIKKRSSSASTTSVTDAHESHGAKEDETESDDENSPKAKKPAKSDGKGLKQETDIKVCNSYKKKMPKTQTAAMWQIVKSLEESTSKQEKKNDERLNAMLEADRKRDKLFLKFQREQAQASREHELVMARLFLQAGINQPSTSGFTGPSSFSGASAFYGAGPQMDNPPPFYPSVYPPMYSQGESNNFDMD